jgi:dihydroxyacetone kinase-like predicted kinase
MYLIDCADGEVPGFRSELAGLGDSVVVVGGGGTYNAHVHTDEPDAAVAAGRRVGTPREVRVTSLDEQVAEHCLAGQARGVPAMPAPHEASTPGSLVAVAEGKGLVRLFESLGAAVVEGGPGSNPSVRDLLEAVERAPGDLVVLLPNHRNVWPAADAAAEESTKRVEVIRTRSVPQGLAAALELPPDGGAPDPEALRAAAERAGGGVIARAERAAETPAGPVTPGTWVGIDAADGEIRAAGAEVAEVAAALARRLAAEHHELATLFVGEEGDDGEAERVAEAVRASAGLEVEIQRGDQPRYPYLIGFE